jgi:hypothetical protein
VTFTFSRVSAGLYEVQKDSNTVGIIRKVNAGKWLVADVADIATPQHISKTLKDAKDACINLIIFDVVDNTPEPVYNNSVKVDNHLNSIELQRQMLENMSNLQVKVPTLQPISF